MATYTGSGGVSGGVHRRELTFSKSNASKVCIAFYTRIARSILLKVRLALD